MVPGAHGVFDLTVNGDVVYSKLKEKRFPDLRELTDPIKKMLD